MAKAIYTTAFLRHYGGKRMTPTKSFAMNKYMFLHAIIRVYYFILIPTPAVWFITPAINAFMKERAFEMLRHHHFSQQVLLAERVALWCAR